VAARVDLLKHLASTNLDAFRKTLPQVLADSSPAVRGQAIILVAEHEMVDALPRVVSLLRDKSDEVRYDAAECVGLLRKGTGTVYKDLRLLLSSRNALVRTQALESLALIGDKGALPKIARLLSDRDPIVRSFAATAIADMKGAAYAGHIDRALRNEKQEPARVGLLEAAFCFGRRKTINQLLGLLGSRDYHVRCSTANALEFLPLNRSERTRAVDALRKAARYPLTYADGSTVKRVLRRLASRLKARSRV
jgi:HEAT repeat protein